MSIFAALPCASLADTGGAGVPAVPPPQVPPAAPGTGGGTTPTGQPTTTAARARLQPDGTAKAPASAPAQVKNAIWAANRIIHKPYIWGGGHRRWEDRGYDCSGAVSYALHGGGFIDSPGDAVVLGRLGIMGRGPGTWITYLWNHQHGWAIIAGLRFDTSGPGESGPRWRRTKRSQAGFYVRHPEGF